MKSWVLSMVALTLLVAHAQAAEQVDYVRQIKPILKKYCYECHGAKDKESGLRLDTAQAAIEGGARGAGLIAGKSAESLLIVAVTGADDDLLMPPEGDRLTDTEIALLKTWIDQGAQAPDDEVALEEVTGRDHWAFQPIKQSPLPKIKQQDWVRNPIDAFILARLEAKGIKPSPEARREALIRRLSLDLLGLPPTIPQVDAFVADKRPDAYEHLVDRLFESPHYGERWGRHWLDVARYADSNGFTIDSRRDIWMYRDWVIAALNRNQPFDQFTIEQVAGDMLEKPSTEQLIATGFHRNTLINEEGGTDDEQFRVESVVDRINTTGAAFLGLTVGCAQCHDHKYDPVSQREFYQLFALYNGADEPKLPVPNTDQAKRQKELSAQTAEAKKHLASRDKSLAAQLAEGTLTLKLGEVEWTTLDPIEFTATGEAKLVKLDDRSLLASGKSPARGSYTVVAKSPVSKITAVRLEVLTHESLPKTGPGVATDGNFVLTRFLLAGESKKAVSWAKATADFAHKNYPVKDAINANPLKGWGIADPKNGTNHNRTAVFVAQGAQPFKPDSKLTFTLKHDSLADAHLIGRFRLSVTNSSPDLLDISPEVRSLAATPSEKLTDKQRKSLLAAYQKSDPERQKLASAVAKLNGKLAALNRTIPTTMIMRPRKVARKTHVHLRGDFTRKGAEVHGGVPSVLPDFPEDVKDPTRLDLARWLVDRRNPLTPRVTVNRFWQRLFGAGIVTTENDFGARGDPPSHPQLLDWLAHDFMRDWNVKRIQRLIVTSATYRQSSQARPELKELDPRSALLARQRRVRLDAEIVRDVALATSGLLSSKLGGPSVFPPQPQGLDRFTQNKKNWKTSAGEDRFRRGMYTFFWRSSPDPFLMTFDAPTGNSTCTRRVRSNTPLQALTLANDAAFVELAQGLALRTMKESSAHIEDRVRYAFRVSLAREPSTSELARLMTFYETQKKSFADSPDDAKALAPAKLPEAMPLADAAALTALARVLLNLDEFITRE